MDYCCKPTIADRATVVNHFLKKRKQTYQEPPIGVVYGKDYTCSEVVAIVKLSDWEWLVLGVPWDSGGAALKELVQTLQQDTGRNRNTALTYLTRMATKGLVAIDKKGYSSAF